MLPVSWANNTKDISRYTLTRCNSLIFVDLEAQGYNQLIYHGKSPFFFKNKNNFCVKQIVTLLDYGFLHSEIPINLVCVLHIFDSGMVEVFRHRNKLESIITDIKVSPLR